MVEPGFSENGLNPKECFMLGIIDATAGQALGGRWICVTLRSLCKATLILNDNGEGGVGKIRNKKWDMKGWHLPGSRMFHSSLL